MGFFKNSKGSRKTATHTVGGEAFALTEPSAYDRTVYLEKLNEHVEESQKHSENLVKQSQIWYSLNCYLIAICLTEHFKGKSVDEIWALAKTELTNEDIESFLDIVEEISGLKLGGSENSSQTETSQED